MTPPSDGSSQQTYHRGRRPASRLLTGALVAAGIAYCCLRWRPSRIEIRGSSMAPQLWAGDWALTVPARRVAIGDVVVIEHPRRRGFEMVKRIVATPGDLDPSGDPLGPDGWWVEGDNPDQSTDSRHFGPVARTDIIAHVRLVYWPPHRRRLV